MDRLASMETFIRVVETGSFSGAARQLRVGQPAVSKTVAQLETYLGAKLLTRSTRGLTPTEAGLGYFERAKRAIEEADEAELAARGAGTGLKGRLRICAAVTFARIHLIPLLPQFLAQHPDLDLEVVLDDRQIDLVQEGIDLALRMGKTLDSALTVRQGRADAFYNSTPGAVELMDKVPGVYAVAGSEFENTTRIGMAVRKGDAAMKAALEAALKEIAADGSYKRLIETWKFPASVSLFD